MQGKCGMSIPHTNYKREVISNGYCAACLHDALNMMLDAFDVGQRAGDSSAIAIARKVLGRKSGS